MVEEEESVHMIEDNTFSKEPSLWTSPMIYDIYQSRFAAFECQFQCSLSFADEEQ